MVHQVQPISLNHRSHQQSLILILLIGTMVLVVRMHQGHPIPIRVIQQVAWAVHPLERVALVVLWGVNMVKKLLPWFLGGLAILVVSWFLAIKYAMVAIAFALGFGSGYLFKIFKEKKDVVHD